MAVFDSEIYQNEDGTIGYHESGWNNMFGKKDTDMQKYVLEYNNAINQYNQQYALQKEAQEANLQNMSFNQSLATRQQEMSEEAYYNGVINEARQKASLGINPAAAGAVGSGMSMSGGSNVSGVPGVSAQGRNPNAYNSQARKMMMLQYLTYAANLKKQQAEIDNLNANSKATLLNAESNAGLSGANKAQVEAITQFLNEKGYLPSSGYSNTEEGFSWSKVLGVGSALALGLQMYGNNRNNNNKSNPFSGSGKPTKVKVTETDSASNTQRQLDLLPAIEANLSTVFADVPSVESLAKGVGLDLNPRVTPTYGSLLKEKLKGVNRRELMSGILLALSVAGAGALAII